MKKFSRIYIEITNVCNLSCSFCVGNEREPHFMSAAAFAALLPQVKQFTDNIYLHVLGEPLLHPQLSEMLSLANAAALKVNITTNGTLLKEQQSLLLSAPALRKVSVSLHSMQQGEGKSDYLSNAAEFAIAAAKNNIICDLRLWNLGEQGNENASVFEQLCSLLCVEEGAKRHALEKIYEVGSAVLIPKVFLGTAARFEWPSMGAKRENRAVFCHGLRNQAAILCDGTVVPCCLDSKGDIPLGNALKSPLAQILASERAKNIYDGFSERRAVEELCNRCGYARRF